MKKFKKIDTYEKIFILSILTSILLIVFTITSSIIALGYSNEIKDDSITVVLMPDIEKKYDNNISEDKHLEIKNTTYNKIETENIIEDLKVEEFTEIKSNEITYTDEDVYWLAVALTEEVGCSWMPEYLRNYVGCVVLNRVDSDLYPNTIYDVLHQEGQYPWASKASHKEPFEWCIKTAEDLLNGNRMLPSDIIFQAEFKQGSYTYATYYDEVLGSTIYFCGL